MKLKSLKLARNCMDLVSSESDKKNALTELVEDARKDVDGCIKVVEKQIEDLKQADIVNAMGTCLCFNILVDFPDRGYIKKDDPLNPHLRAEKIEKEEKAKRSNI